MAGEKERVDPYLDTLSRLEPDIATIDASAFYASAAISLKRIADAIEANKKPGLSILIGDAESIRAIQMLHKLRDRQDECLGDHPDWLREIDAILGKV